MTPSERRGRRLKTRRRNLRVIRALTAVRAPAKPTPKGTT